MSPVLIRPVDGARVLRPDGTVLPEAGHLVVLDTYWRRRIADGDVEVVED